LASLFNVQCFLSGKVWYGCSQENAIWCEVEVDKMKAAEGGMLTYACKCGGTYAGIVGYGFGS
jgi:hypothetical protein